MPLVASNRIGTESDGRTSIRFYGSSFIADHTGAVVAQASEDTEEVVTATFDLDAVREYRERWSVFRDRRPELYGTLLTLGGERPRPDGARRLRPLIARRASRRAMRCRHGRRGGRQLSVSYCSPR